MISNETNRLSYPGDGSTTVFPYTFKIFEEGDIAVNLVVDSTQVTTLQTITTHYTVDGEGTDAGGNVTFVTAPAAGTTVVLTRNQPLTQETNYTDNDTFPAETHEAALDKCMAAIQMLSERLDRALGVPVGSSSTGLVVPLSTNRADHFVKINGTGTGFDTIEVDTLSGTFADISSDTSPSLGGDLDAAGFNLKVTGGSSYLLESTDSKKYVGFTKTTNAVNYFNFTNAATGNGPNFSVLGADTNININLTAKGTGSVAIANPLSVVGEGTFNAGLVVKNGATSGGYLQLFENSDNGTNWVKHQAADSLASNTTYKWPVDTPVGGYFLTSNASGVLSWAAPKLLKQVSTIFNTATNTTASIPIDNTIPQNTEGTALFSSASFTPTSASSTLTVRVDIPLMFKLTTGSVVLSLFRDSTANAIGACIVTLADGYAAPMNFTVPNIATGSTSATTFHVRYGGSGGGTVYFMSTNTLTTGAFGAANTASITISEYA